MRLWSSFFLLALSAILALADAVNFSALEDLERGFEARLANGPADLRPFEMLSNAAAMYIPGVGVMLSSRVNLIYENADTPFRPQVPPAQRAAELAIERQKLHRDKLAKVPVLEQAMRECLADAAASPKFDAVLPTEKFMIGVTLFYIPTREDITGLPRQITMSAEKQKLIQARRDKVDLATVIQEQKL
jgi:hypothetical protein